MLIEFQNSLTFIVILGGDGEHRVLDVFVLINLCFVERLVEVRWVVVLVSDSNANKLGDCERERKDFCLINVPPVSPKRSLN